MALLTIEFANGTHREIELGTEHIDYWKLDCNGLFIKYKKKGNRTIYPYHNIICYTIEIDRQFDTVPVG